MIHIVCCIEKSGGVNYIQRLLADTPDIKYQLTTQIPEKGFYLTIDKQGLLELCLKGSTLTLNINYLSLSMRRRIDNKTKKIDLIRAVQGRSKSLVKILDMTAGLGQDSLTLAAQGYHVTAIEKNPYIFIMFKQQLLRAKYIGLDSVSDNVKLYFGDSSKIDIPKKIFDVIYLDPMFPVCNKNTKPKKAMQLLQMLISYNPIKDSLLLRNAKLLHCKKIIVKRHRIGCYLANQKPTSQIVSKSIRFDIYATQHNNLLYKT